MGNYGGGNSAVQGGVYALAGFTEALRKHQEFKMKYEKYLQGKAMAEEQQELEQSRFKLQEDAQKAQRLHETSMLKYQEKRIDLQAQANADAITAAETAEAGRTEQRGMNWIADRRSSKLKDRELDIREDQIAAEKARWAALDTKERNKEERLAQREILSDASALFRQTLKQYLGQDFESVRDPELRAEALAYAKEVVADQLGMQIAAHNDLYETELDMQNLEDHFLKDGIVPDVMHKDFNVTATMEDFDSDKIFTEDELEEAERVGEETNNTPLLDKVKEYKRDDLAATAIMIVDRNLKSHRGARLTEAEAKALEEYGEYSLEHLRAYEAWGSQDEEYKWRKERPKSNIPRKVPERMMLI